MRRNEKLLAGQGPPPPADFTPSSAALWREIVGAKLARSPERLEMLTVALRARDRLLALQAALAAQQLVLVSERSRLTRLNPLVNAERAALQQFTKLWVQLELHERDGVDSAHDRERRVPEVFS